MIDRFIFCPRKNNSHYSKLWKNAEIILKVNQQMLQGWFVKATTFEEAPLIIYYGGNAENISINLGDMQTDEIQSTSWLLMNYRGFGGSTGKPSQEGLFADALANYDYLINDLNIQPDKIYLVGRSIGSSIAAYVASQRRVGGLILITPFDSIASFAPRILRISPVKYYLEKYFNTQKYLEDVKGKILVLAAGEDEVVPKMSLANLANKFKNQLEIVEIKDANHQNITEFPEYELAIQKYIHQL